MIVFCVPFSPSVILTPRGVTDMFMILASLKDYAGTLCMFTKILSVFLYGQYNVLMAAAYVVLCIRE